MDADDCDKIAGEKQPRRGDNQAVSEYKGIIEVAGCSADDLRQILDWHKTDRKAVLHWMDLEVREGWRVLSVSKEVGSESGLRTVELGMPWSAEEFVEKAKKLMHPFDKEVLVPPAVAEVIIRSAGLGPTKSGSDRKATMAYYTDRAKALARDEAKLHKTLHPDVEGIVKNKRILLFREMLTDIGYDDMGVVKLLEEGIRVVGDLEKVGIWKPADALATLGPKTLWANSALIQKEMLTPRPPCEEDQAVWDATVEEEKLGGIAGPYTAQEVTAKAGSFWVGARRFAILQNGKIRVIDDFSEFGINKAFGLNEKAHMKGLDQIVAWAKVWASSLQPNGVVRVVSLGEGAT